VSPSADVGTSFFVLNSKTMTNLYVYIIQINNQHTVICRGETIHRDAIGSWYSGLDSMFDPFNICFGWIRFQHYSTHYLR
jgi:hypothetical protein